MKITVSGKAHLESVSRKTNNPFIFNQIHYLSPARGAEGLAAKTLNLDSTMYPLSGIQVGKEYLLEFDDRGYPVTFELVQK